MKYKLDAVSSTEDGEVVEDWIAIETYL